MIIGVPKEIMHGEGRVSATPETVAKMVQDGATVLVETNAGAGAFLLMRNMPRLELKFSPMLQCFTNVLT